MEERETLSSNSQEFCLQWNNYFPSLTKEFNTLKLNSCFTDVTLVCEGKNLPAHRMLLAACSFFFRDIFVSNPCQHPIVILPSEVKFIDLENLIIFMYQGQVNVQQEALARFLKTAEMLKIRGLGDHEEKTVPKIEKSMDRRNSSGRETSPKRARLSAGDKENKPSTPTSEESQSAGVGELDMLPVKTEVVEHEVEPDSYVQESSSTAPPPPGPLLPSYVPPPQVKAQDDNTRRKSYDDGKQGGRPRLVSTRRSGNRKETSYDGHHEFWVNGPPLLTPPFVSRPPTSLAGANGSSESFRDPSPSLGRSRRSLDQSNLSSANNSPSLLHRSNSLSVLSPLCSQSSNASLNTAGSTSIWRPDHQSSSVESSPAISSDSRSVGGACASDPLACDVCSKTFTSRSNLNKHKKVQHSGEKFFCPLCTRTFKNKYYIKDHMVLCSGNNKKPHINPPYQTNESSRDSLCETPVASSTKPLHGKILEFTKD